MADIKKDWKDNQLSFKAVTLGEPASGRMNVEDQVVEIVVDLPDSLGLMARRIGRGLLREGERLLEKK